MAARPDEHDTDPEYKTAETVQVPEILENDLSTYLDQGLITCPVCGFDYTHVKECKEIYSDGGTAWSGGRGSATYVYMYGECGHEWRVRFGNHKGQTYLAVEYPRNQK